MTDYSKLSDEELIEAVADKVMGWEKTECKSSEFAWVTGYTDQLKEKYDCYCIVPFEMDFRVHARSDWNPLENWNDTMQVVEKMQSEYIDFTMHHEPDFGIGGWEIWFGNIEQFYGGQTPRTENPQRAILLAALQAND